MRRAIVHQKRRAVYGPLKKMESGHIPLLASPQGGVAAPIQKMLRSLLSGRSRGGFPFCSHSENHPGLAIGGGFAAFYQSLGHPSFFEAGRCRACAPRL